MSHAVAHRSSFVSVSSVEMQRATSTGSTSSSTAGYGSIADTESSANRYNETPRIRNEDDDPADRDVSYYHLLSTNRPFRLFLLSYIANHMGDWLTYLASVSAIERVQQQSTSGMDADADTSTRMTAISVLLVIRLTPNVLLMPFGGVLADGLDRRKCMIALDIAGAVVAWLFILAVQWQSIGMIYAAAFLQECLSGLYEPSRSAFIPLLAPEEAELKKATTLVGMAWSFIAAMGSASGGFLVSLLGVRYCYLIDSFTYLLSAFLMVLIRGNWNVSTADKNDLEASPVAFMRDMLSEGLKYLRSSFFGPLVFLKIAILDGATDVLNVSVSESDDASESAARLGVIYACMGIGCLLGPLISGHFTDMNDPKGIQVWCLYAMAILASGYFLIGAFVNYIPLVALFTTFRDLGTSMLWVNSSLLLQKFSAPDMLGRVTSIEFSVTLFASAVGALASGWLEDYAHFSASQLSFTIGSIVSLLLIFWSAYHCSGRGAGAYRGATDKTSQETESSGSETSSLIRNGASLDV